MAKHKGKKLILNIVLVLIVVPLLIGQSQPSQSAEADIFFLDLGIAIEPPTGKEAYSRLIETPTQEIKIKIKKAESGAIYMAASQEMLELLKRIQERVDQLEETFSKEVDLIQSENKEIKDIIAVITNPPLRKPERPEVFIPANNSFVDDSSFEDVTIETVFSVLEMPPLMLLPKQSLATPQQQFSQLVYMSAVFAYQREEYKEALNYFLALSFTGANQRTVGNVLYWMAFGTVFAFILIWVLNEDNMDSIKSAQIQNTLFSQLTDKNLERLRSKSEFGKGASKKEMEKVARDFESVFINKLFESMRKAIPKSGLLDSSAMDMYQSMMDQEMAKELSKRKGMGMGEMVYNDLSRMNKLLRGETFPTSLSQIPLTQKTGNELGE